MKTHRFVSCASGLYLAVLLVVSNGCATRGYHAGERTAANLQAAATRIEAAGRQMDLAVTELDALVNQPQPDLRPQFDRFSAAVGQLNTLATNITRAAAQLQARNRLHAEAWNQEIVSIRNETIRATAEARKLDVAARFDSVRSTCTAAQTSLGAVQGDLLDLQRYLNSDLTMGGLASIRDTATRVGRNAAPAREAVTKLVSELRALGVAMAPQNAAALSPTSEPVK